MNQYLKVILKTGGEILFPLAFWQGHEDVTSGIPEEDIADCFLVGGAV